MQRREFIFCLGLVVAICGGVTAVVHVWKIQRTRDLALSGILVSQDMARLSPDLRSAIEKESDVIRTAAQPVIPLEKLAELAYANGLAALEEQALGALRKLEPSNPHWPYLLADLRVRQNNQPAAEQALVETTKLEPSYWPAQVRLGELQLGRGDYEDARKTFATVVEHEPQNVFAQYSLISIDAYYGDKAGDVTDRLNALIRDHPYIKLLYKLRADVFELHGDHAHAAEARQQASQAEMLIDRTDPWLDDLMVQCFEPTRLLMRAYEVGREGRLAEDEAMLKRAVALAPKNQADPLLWQALANLYTVERKPAEARATLEKAVTEFPDEAEMYKLLAEYLIREKNPGEAITVIQPAMQRWPAQGKLKQILGVALHDAGQNDQAVVPLEEALRLDPTLTEAQYTLARSLLDLKKRPEARLAFEKTLAMRPEHTDALYALGGMLLETGDVQAAEPYVNKLYSLQPGSDYAKYLLAALHWVKGQQAEKANHLAEADQEFRAGVAVYNRFPPLLQKTGWVEMQRGEYADAAAVFRQYLVVAPNDLRARLYLGIALKASGQEAAARTTLTEGLTAAQQAANEPLIAEYREALGP